MKHQPDQCAPAAEAPDSFPPMHDDADLITSLMGLRITVEQRGMRITKGALAKLIGWVLEELREHKVAWMQLRTHVASQQRVDLEASQRILRERIATLEAAGLDARDGRTLKSKGADAPAPLPGREAIAETIYRGMDNRGNRLSDIKHEPSRKAYLSAADYVLDLLRPYVRGLHDHADEITPRAVPTLEQITYDLHRASERANKTELQGTSKPELNFSDLSEFALARLRNQAEYVRKLIEVRTVNEPQGTP